MHSSFRYLFVLLAVLIVPSAGHGVTAYPHPITYTQPDGSQVTLRLHGDEFLHWLTRDSAVVERGSDGFFHSTGEIAFPSTFRREQAAMQKAAARMHEQVERAAKNHTLSLGNKHFLVLLIQTPDMTFSVPSARKAFSDMLNLEGYSENGGTGSAAEYFSDQSLGKFTPEFDVYGPITVPDSMKVYSKQGGRTQEGAPMLLAKACQLIDSEIDFTQYDIDNDGSIDNIFFYYAGFNAAEGAEGTIWPHAWSVNKKYTFDGKRLNGYACTSEYRGISGTKMAGIGTFCHEFSHVIGLPDFYDTNDETDGLAKGLGIYSLMGIGNYNNDGCTPPYFNCEERMMLGWLDSIPQLPDASGMVTLVPLQTNAGYVSPTDSTGEYFYYEYRNRSKWDAPNPGGLLIYHIDKSSRMVGGISAGSRWSSLSGINAMADHECFKLLESSGISGGPIPFGNSVHFFNANTDPAAVSWSGAPTGYDLYDISGQGDTLSFQLIRNDRHRLFGTVTDMDANPVYGASIVLNDGALQTTSDENGLFELLLDTLSDFSIMVKAQGYNPWKTILSAPRGACYVEITLSGTTERKDVLLSKNSGVIHMSMGIAPQKKTYAKVLFTARETAPFTGLTFQQISFVTAGNKNQEEHISCRAFLRLNKETVLEQSPDTLWKNSWSHVRFAQKNITLPLNASVEIGYWVCSDYAYPLAVDDIPGNGSSYYSIDGNQWYPLPENMNNFLITALLKDTSTGKTVPMIPSLQCLSRSGFVWISGLEDNLPVHFITPDGRLLETVLPYNGQVEWQAPASVGMILIRQGTRSVKMMTRQ